MAQDTAKVAGLVAGFIGAIVVIAAFFLFSFQPFIVFFLPVALALLIGLVLGVWREGRMLRDPRITRGLKIWAVIGLVTGSVSFYAGVTLKNPLIIPPVMLILYFLARRSKVSPDHSKRSPISPGLSKIIHGSGTTLQMSDDQRIVTLTSELCRQLGITRFMPSDVIWVQRHPASTYESERMPPDRAVFNDEHIYLASSVREKMEAEDWRPIIAASLIFTFRVGTQKLSSNLRWTLGCLAYLSAFAVIGKVIGGFLSSLTALFLAAALLVPVGLLYALRVGKTVNMRILRADLKTAELVGGERLVSTLKKIDNMHLPDVERNNELRARRSLRSYGPSLPKRIDNLLSGRAELAPSRTADVEGS